MTAAEALGCEACGLPISPCLVCANPFSFPRVDDSQIKTCRSCGVVNPLGNWLHLFAVSSTPGNCNLCCASVFNGPLEMEIRCAY